MYNVQTTNAITFNGAAKTAAKVTGRDPEAQKLVHFDPVCMCMHARIHACVYVRVLSCVYVLCHRRAFMRSFHRYLCYHPCF